MEALRVATAGTGNIARVHAKALREPAGATAPAARLTAVMDVDDRQLGSFGREFAIRETYRREFDELAAAEGNGRGPWFATVFQHRFGSGQRRLKALANSGALGRPLVAICHTTWFRGQQYFDVPWRGRWDTEGGGPTMGHGIHQMDMLLDVLGEWTAVSAVPRRGPPRPRTCRSRTSRSPTGRWRAS